jgi:hypothetical protein
MKRWEFVLQDCGITYRSHRSKGQRFVDVTYTPPEAGVTEVTQVTENVGG